MFGFAAFGQVAFGQGSLPSGAVLPDFLVASQTAVGFNYTVTVPLHTVSAVETIRTETFEDGFIS
jgi:hypothetical protein